MIENSLYRLRNTCIPNNMSSQDRHQLHRALDPKKSGIGHTSNSGIADPNLVDLDQDDTNLPSAGQVRPDKTTSESYTSQTSESDREPPNDLQYTLHLLSIYPRLPSARPTLVSRAHTSSSDLQNLPFPSRPAGKMFRVAKKNVRRFHE